MTHNPDDLLAVRGYLLAKLDLLPGTARGVDLEPGEVGIAGDPAHAAGGGYHEGNDDLARVGLLNSDYSKRESPRDRPGSNAASALDIGDFDAWVNGRHITLRSLSTAIVDACRRGDPRTRDIREVIYTPDGSTVARWDRLGIRTGGDSSHLWHTHLDWFRDSEGRRHLDDNVLGLLRELLEGKPAGAPIAFTPIGEEMHKELRMSDLNHVTGGASPSVGYVGGFLRLTSFWGDSVVTFDRRNGTVVVDGKRVEAPRVHEEITVKDGGGPVQRDLPDGCEWSIALKDTTHNTPTNETHTETFCVVETYGNRG